MNNEQQATETDSLEKQLSRLSELTASIHTTLISSAVPLPPSAQHGLNQLSATLTSISRQVSQSSEEKSSLLALREHRPGR